MGSHSSRTGKHLAQPKHLRPGQDSTNPLAVWGVIASLVVAMAAVLFAASLNTTDQATVTAASETTVPTTKRTVTVQVEPTPEDTAPVILDPYAKDSGLISQSPSTTSRVPAPSTPPVNAPGGITARISATTAAPAPTTTVAPAPTTTEAPAPPPVVAPAAPVIALNPRCDPLRLNNPEPQTVAGCNLVMAAVPEIPYVGGRATRPANPTSCHPKGLGLDFMVYEDRALGDRVAQYVRDNADTLGATTILWQVDDHYDHIHVSFEPCRA